MPNFDQTGPQGKGPMTGRGQGMCGPGSCHCRHCGCGSLQTKAEKVADLKNYQQALEEELEEVKKVLADWQA